MSIEIWISFILASAVLCITPGLTVFFLISQFLAYGKKIVTPMILGGLTGDMILMCLSFIGLSAVLATSTYLFTVLKIVGACYLIYFGIKTYRSKATLKIGGKLEIKNIKKRKVYQDAVLVTASNPKGIIFSSAFFPLFINIQNEILPQLVTLAISFMFVAASVNITYCFFSSYLSTRVKTKKMQERFNKISGTILISAGLLAASMQK